MPGLRRLAHDPPNRSIMSNSVASRPTSPTVSVRELKQKLDAREPVQLVDVREPFEHEIASIDSARLIPLGELPDRWSELGPRIV